MQYIHTGNLTSPECTIIVTRFVKLFPQTSSSWKAYIHCLLHAGPLRSPPAPRDIAPSTSAMLASVRAAIPADLHSAPTKQHVTS